MIVLSLRVLPTWETSLSPLLCLWRKRRAKEIARNVCEKVQSWIPHLAFRVSKRRKNQRRALSPLVVPSTRYLPTDLINVTRNIELYILHLKFLVADGAYSHFKIYNHNRVYVYQRNLIVGNLIFWNRDISNLHQDCQRSRVRVNAISARHQRNIWQIDLLVFLVFLAAPFREIRLDFTERSYYPRKLVLANARSGKTVPTRGSRAGPTTNPHSRIKHKCHLLCLILTSREHLLFFLLLVLLPPPHLLLLSLFLFLFLFTFSFPSFFFLVFRDLRCVADSRTCFCCQISYSFPSPFVFSRISFHDYGAESVWKITAVCIVCESVPFFGFDAKSFREVSVVQYTGVK